jgi:hypothetical protein
MIKGKGNTMGTQGDVDDKTCLYWLSLKIWNKIVSTEIVFPKGRGTKWSQNQQKITQRNFKLEEASFLENETQHYYERHSSGLPVLNECKRFTCRTGSYRVIFNLRYRTRYIYVGLVT